jgi:tetratricopeptide (TPR) repeat protein
MSLLIKALDKAEKAQVEQQKLEQDKLDLQQAGRRRAKNIANDELEIAEAATPLTLADIEPEPTQPTAGFVSTQYSGEHTSERASNMFASKADASTEIKPIIWIILFGVLGFLGIVGYFYYQLNVVQAPVMPTVNPTVLQTSNAQRQQNLETSNIPTQQMAVDRADAEVLAPSPVSEDPIAGADKTKGAQASEPELVVSTAMRKRSNAASSQTAETESLVGVNAAPIEVPRTTQGLVVPTIASESASIQISRNQPAPAISPMLMSAYQAFLAGNYDEAQGLYKRTLQRDTRNVDAMLGLGAIAERQGRMNDAFGWYQKVLEADPKNATALSAYANYAQDDQSRVQKLKNIVTENPNDANAHANLGAYFVEQSRWAEAQQAYFEAFRLNASAENAFNLAISLDHMAKPALALPYYQRSLDLVTASPSTTIDINALQARITAIQSK